MDVQIERGAEALDNGHAASLEDAAYPCSRARRRSQRETTPTKARSTAPARAGSKAMPKRRPKGTVSTHSPHGDLGHDSFAKVRREVAHAAAEARRTEAAALARKCNEAALPAAVASDADEPVGQDAAPEERLDLVDHESG